MLEYIDEAHLYLYDGVIIPSVTQILQKIFKNKYKGVPKFILEEKAKYGSEIHKLIEDLENGKEYNFKSVYQEISIEQYLDLKAKNNIVVIDQEQMVCYEGKYAGRYDMTAIVNDSYSLVDIKTTAELDLEYLSWQLSLYEYASRIIFSKFYVIWLPKGKMGQLVEVEKKSEEEIEKLLEEIEKNGI